MADSHSEFVMPDRLLEIFKLFKSIGYSDQGTNLSVSFKLADGLAWCIAAVNGPGRQYGDLSIEPLDETNKIAVLERIEEDLRLIGCPYPFRFSMGEQVDVERDFLVVQWLVDAVTKKHAAGRDENKKEINVSKELQPLKGRLNKGDSNATMQKLISLAESLKDLKQEECEYLSNCEAERSILQQDIMDLEEKLANGSETRTLLNSLDHSLNESFELVNSGKKELATRLRKILSLRRLHDDIPTESELVQYELRISELYARIQEKLKQTRKYFATYNALLEIKEMMVKETSLLNSISSQFQDAFTSTAGRMKLIDSMEGIVKGLKQKREKVQLGLDEEQKVCNALKEKYGTEMGEQRRCYSLLKGFQCAGRMCQE